MADIHTNIKRDLIQSRLLSAIFSRSIKNQVVLKGGMAMRVLFGSQRYTKDIDLGQNQDQSLRSLQSMMRLAIKDSVQGFLENVSVTEPKQIDTVARWKIGGNVIGGGTEIHITVEVSRRGVPEGHVVQKNFIPPKESYAQTTVIDVYDHDAMIFSKVIALHSENRVAPRDLYDLHIMISSEVRP
ncbi:protein containing DUF1814, partial [mine drainage metagenome]